MEEAQVLLVDEHDNEIGSMGKMEAHRLGKLHRAFSVLIFNTKGQMLLQKRAHSKYHSGGLWSNACCSHPRSGETLTDAVRKQLRYEMGIDVEPIFIFKFMYQSKFSNGLIEHEMDHVFVGNSDAVPLPNREEAEDWKYESLSEIKGQIEKHPELFTVWLKKIIEQLPEKIGS